MRDVKPFCAWAAALAIVALPALAEPSRLKPFFDAALYGSVEQVRRLVDEDKSLVKARDPSGFSVLHIVATEDRPQVQQLLLEAGADANAVNNDEVSALHIASYPSFAALLIRHGARVNLAAKNGDTPLHSHASERDSAAVA